MATNYAYKYAILDTEYIGMCVEVQDTTTYILDPNHVPIEDETIDYLFKYYYPIPETVTNFDDFQGKWYYDAEHTQLFEEGNA